MLSALKFQKRQQQLADLTARESALRAELARLRELAFETHAQPADQAQLRAIGGDVIWLRWLGQARQRLNLDLAQVLAQKEAYMAQFKREHGKKLVSEALCDAATKEKAAHRNQKQLDEAIRGALGRNQ
ncbi:hypothetical protein [uncultured Tateyamaria sp.]|uniref:hypothetical protein n=1 Tax=uncultured Tateyamaria sp. TaxID=455651 RepID=UPI0026326610|nr:hypothetical protein [uncultured Tateyamaria sp.]